MIVLLFLWPSKQSWYTFEVAEMQSWYST